MKMSELIAAYGDDKLQFQPLDQCISTIDYSAKKGTKITFGTDAEIDIRGNSGTVKMGIILWLDRDEVARLIAEEKNDGK